MLAATGYAEATPEPGEDSFTAGNHAILRAARARGDVVVALVIAAPGESAYTEAFAHAAVALGVPVARLP